MNVAFPRRITEVKEGLGPCSGHLVTGTKLFLSPQPIHHTNQILHICSDPFGQSKIFIIRTNWASGFSWCILNSYTLNKKFSQQHWHLTRFTTGSACRELENHCSVLTTNKKLNRLKIINNSSWIHKRGDKLPPRLERQSGKYRESGLPRSETQEWKPSMGTRVCIGKLEQSLTNCWQLSVDKPDS